MIITIMWLVRTKALGVKCAGFTFYPNFIQIMSSISCFIGSGWFDGNRQSDVTFLNKNSFHVSVQITYHFSLLLFHFCHFTSFIKFFQNFVPSIADTFFQPIYTLQPKIYIYIYIYTKMNQKKSRYFKSCISSNNEERLFHKVLHSADSLPDE